MPDGPKAPVGDEPVPPPSAATAEPANGAPPPPSADSPDDGRISARSLARALSFRNISALYVFVVIFVVFSLWVPETFPTWDTWKALLDSQAVTALLAVGLVVALAAGAFELAIGAELGFGAILVAWLLAEQGVPIVPAIVLTVLAGAVIGLIIGLLVVRARIDSFIATLGVSSILLAMIAWVSSSQQILGLSPQFQDIGTTEVFGITLPVYIMLAVAFAVWYVLERTAVGRRVYATGGNIEAARLAGVRTGLVIVAALVTCAAIASLAGILVSSRLGTGDPTIGPAYLLPAFSAAFLGSTQFRGGRFNVWGTVVAVYVLAAGVKGLQLAGAPIWIPDLFNGVALLIAVGMAKYQRAAYRAGAVRRLLRMDRREEGQTAAG
jgi:ribose transport system permease protein